MVKSQKVSSVPGRDLELGRVSILTHLCLVFVCTTVRHAEYGQRAITITVGMELNEPWDGVYVSS